MYDQLILLWQKLDLSFPDFDVLDCVYDFLTHLLISFILVVHADIAKCLTEVFEAIMF
jgi:hypothetical protein